MRSAHAVGHALCRGAAVTALLMVPGCGDATSPAEAVPELGSALARVDRALANGDLVRAQRRLDRLVRVTVTARRSGDLETAESDAILAAAASLAAHLPRGGPLPGVSEPAAPDGSGDGEDPAEEPAPEGGGGLDEEDAEERAEELEKKREELRKEREERRKELEKQQEDKQEEDEQEEGGKSEGKGRGNGNSGGNGPDDGHGN